MYIQSIRQQCDNNRTAVLRRHSAAHQSRLAPLTATRSSRRFRHVTWRAVPWWRWAASCAQCSARAAASSSWGAARTADRCCSRGCCRSGGAAPPVAPPAAPSPTPGSARVHDLCRQSINTYSLTVTNPHFLVSWKYIVDKYFGQSIQKYCSPGEMSIRAEKMATSDDVSSNALNLAAKAKSRSMKSWPFGKLALSTVFSIQFPSGVDKYTCVPSLLINAECTKQATWGKFFNTTLN